MALNSKIMENQIYKIKKTGSGKSKILMLIICMIVFSFKMDAQVNLYNFAQTSGTYTAITGTTLSGSTASTDDTNFPLQNIGFSFVYNGTSYTQVGISANGYVCFGTVSSTYYSNVLGSLPNVVAICSADLLGNASGHGIQVLTSGAVGSRIFTVQFTNWGVYSTGLNEYNFQLKLYETTNAVQIIYGSCGIITSGTRQVGLRGILATDFKNRSTTTNWAATSAGTAVSSTCSVSLLIKPASGLTFTWTPSAVTSPPACASGLVPASATVLNF
jgi:hypothetical protein